MECGQIITPNDLLRAVLGLNNGLTSLRVMQVATTGDYFNCNQFVQVSEINSILKLLIGLNSCNKPAIRVDIVPDDGACLDLDCTNKENSTDALLRSAIGIGADGLPVLRIMQS